MTFYAKFSSWYATVFPFRPPVREFLAKRLPARGRILDIGCGTGDYCGALISSDRSCLGIDLDEQMIQEARKCHPGAEFRVMDMASIAELPAGGFAGIYCIGNVLPHLPAGRLSAFLAHLRSLMTPGGVWIFQIVNFDPIIGRPEYQFPVLDFPAEKLSFIRRYIARADGDLEFQTRLLHQDREVFAGQVPLHPRTSVHLLQLHREAGFQLEGHFADFAGKAFVSEEHSGSVFVFTLPQDRAREGLE